MDYTLSLMAGIDIPIPECQLILHQPTIKEIAYVGETEFFTGIQCLCIDKKMILQDENVLGEVSNFHIFMTVMSQPETQDKKENTVTVLQVLFPKAKVLFTPRALIFQQDDQVIMVDEANFEFFQKAISLICCLKNSDASTFNPGSKAAKKIAEKLMRARQRVAEEKAANGESDSAFAQYVSVLTVGLGSMSLEQCLNLTIFQLQDLMERYGLYIGWDVDLRARMAGAKVDKPMDNWMKNIH